MQKDLSDSKEVKRAERAEKDLRKQELNDIRTVLNNASGRRLIWRMLTKCQVFKTILTENTNTTFYNAGWRDTGLFLLGEITEADENLLFKMMKENQSKDKERMNE